MHQTNKIEAYIQSMSQNEKNAFRFGLTYMISEVTAYMHQIIEKGRPITHDLLTSMEHHYLRDLKPDVFEKTLQLILQKPHSEKKST